MDVICWLLESDPAIRWQVLHDLTDASPDEVAAERARVEREGWGTRLLALEDADGQCTGGAVLPSGGYSRPRTDSGPAAPPPGRASAEPSRVSRGRRPCTPCRPCS